MRERQKKFKVWDSLKNRWSQRSFFFGQDGCLYVWGRVSQSFYEAKLRFKVVFASDKKDESEEDIFDQPIAVTPEMEKAIDEFWEVSE